MDFVDTRLTQMNITGQEMLTADKVSLRINFVCNYRITDPVRINSEIDDFSEQIHVAAQLALREYVGRYKLDEILENKDQMSEFVYKKLKEKEESLFVEICDAGVKDIILPGEIREIMNTVLVAEKRAQANVITRREEVASTRSLLNTAKLKNPITAESFEIHVDKDAKSAEVIVIQTLPYIPIASERHATVPVVDGVLGCNVEEDVLYVSQVERYGINGNVGKAFMGGFNMKEGAVASSVGHDNHNVIVLGTNHEDMALAVNRVVEMGGGQIAVKDGKVIKEIAYPICGLLSDLSAEELAAEKTELINAIREMGSPISYPYMFLSFLCLAAMGGNVITDHGLVACSAQKVIDPVLKLNK